MLALAPLLATLPANIGPIRNASITQSLLFSAEFNEAIVATTINQSDNQVFVYDESKLIEVMFDQIRESDDELTDDEAWEAARDSVSTGLDEALKQMGDHKPVLV